MSIHPSRIVQLKTIPLGADGKCSYGEGDTTAIRVLDDNHAYKEKWSGWSAGRRGGAEHDIRESVTPPLVGMLTACGLTLAGSTLPCFKVRVLQRADGPERVVGIHKPKRRVVAPGLGWVGWLQSGVQGRNLKCGWSRRLDYSSSLQGDRMEAAYAGTPPSSCIEKLTIRRQALAPG